MVKYKVGDYVEVQGRYLPKVDYDKVYVVQVTQAQAYSHTIEVSASWLEGHLGVTNDGNRNKWYIHKEHILRIHNSNSNYIKEV